MGYEYGTTQGNTETWGSVRSVSFLNGGDDNTVKLWDVNTEQLKATLKGHASGVRSVSFSPDGSILASGSDDKTVLLWDVSPAPTPYPGDFDGDLNGTDFLAFVGVFGLSSSDVNYDARMDMNGDGIINFSDFLIFTIIFGTKYS